MAAASRALFAVAALRNSRMREEVSRLSPDGGTPSEHPSTPLVDTPSSSSTPDQNSPREHDLSNETVRMPLFAFVVPAVVTYGTTAWCIVGPVVSLEPFVYWTVAATVVMAAYTAGLIVIGMLGVRRVRRCEAEPLALQPASPFYYAFVIPNYKEPFEVLHRTLERLASHPGAAERYIVVLAMEVREGVDGLVKVRSLARAFPSAFYAFTSSTHTLGAAECPGKASNATAGGRELTRLCAGLRIAPSNVVVTVLDADSLISDRYVLRLDGLICEARSRGDEPSVSCRIFAPYMTFCNADEETIPWMVRLVDAAWSFFLLYQLARPLQVRMPVACYSMSLALLERIGYWEVGECGIGEDAHTALKAFWATGGEASAAAASQHAHLPLPHASPPPRSLRRAPRRSSSASSARPSATTAPPPSPPAAPGSKASSYGTSRPSATR